MSNKIGNNEFFETLRGAKTAGTRRGYAAGARVLSTSAGFCLLELGEGADNQSFKYTSTGTEVSQFNGEKWVDC